jgi:WD40 repeat protein
MKWIYLFVVLVVIFSGCDRNPASSAQSQSVTAAQFSPDGKRIVTTSRDGTTRIWDVRSGEALSSTNRILIRPVPPRYEETPDNTAIVGVDNFKVLQDQIDVLEKRVRELETKMGQTAR